MPRKKRARPGNTRERILQSAYQLFLERGYHATSMRAIARRAGLTVAAAYNHFKNKEQLYTAVLSIHQPYNRILPALSGATGETVEEFLSTAARLIVEALDREPGFLKLILIEIVEFKNKHIPKMFREIYPQLLAVVQSAASLKGRLRPLPPAVLVRSFVGLIYSLYITDLIIWKHLPASMQTDCLDDFVDLYLHGVVEPTPGAAE
jgi:AcrR family transcriptional regulator